MGQPYDSACDAAAHEVEVHFSRIQSAARALRPDVMMSVDVARGREESRWLLSVLFDKDDDELVLEIEVAERAQTIWCELTMFVGQATYATLAVCWWLQTGPVCEQVGPTLGELVGLAEPHFALLMAAKAESAPPQQEPA